ncbi:MAG: 2-phospho-L-lactate transferase [Chloroflexi bacterium]|nr:2-phospho-L-lactate transferase [Chloroflexota bacterium]
MTPLWHNWRVVCLAGGVGGAKMASGLAQQVDPANLTIIANTGDDFAHCGLPICPDLDTLLYTLANVGNPETGWGRAGESWQAMSAVRELGGPTWFNLGDLDLGLHLTRAHWLAQGRTLTEVTAELCGRLGVRPRLLPMSNQPCPTIVETAEGHFPFQEWFVGQRWQPAVQHLHLPDTARATPQVIAALEAADLVIIAPSNPFLSIDPILNAYPIRALLADVPEVVLAVSPLIGGQAVKGPAAKLMAELGHTATAAGVANYYDELLDGFVCAREDAAEFASHDLPILATDILIPDLPSRARLAGEILDFAAQLAEE